MFESTAVELVGAEEMAAETKKSLVEREASLEEKVRRYRP